MALTREKVLSEALRASDADGLDRLSLRTLAARLGVSAPTLYWHVDSKAALLDGLSDAIMGEAIDALPPSDADGTWREWLLEALIALRNAMLAHRDGARIVSGAHDSLRRAEFTERALEELGRGGVPSEQAWLLVLGGTRYALGHVFSEQGPDAAPSAELETEFRERFPLLAGGVAAYFSAATPDDLYEDALRLLIGLPARAR